MVGELLECRDVQPKIMKFLKTIPMSEWDKPTVTNKKGRQDIPGHVRGYAVYIEVKRDGKKGPTKIQQWRIIQSNRKGAYSFWTYSVQDVEQRLNEFARTKGFELFRKDT